MSPVIFYERNTVWIECISWIFSLSSMTIAKSLFMMDKLMSTNKQKVHNII